MGDSVSSLKDILQKANTGRRLSFEDGVRLFQTTDILTLGKMAHRVRQRLHGHRVFYSVNLHLNPTNICSARCDFCAFSRDAGDPDAYALTLDEIENRVRGALDRWHINEVHIVGGLDPALGFDYYLEMVRRIRRITPVLYIKAFSAPEIHDMARRSGQSVLEVLEQLKKAGLEGLPGGGAEIFDPAVRQKLCPKKISGDEWLSIHRVAHEIGLNTNATMLYGHLETEEHRVAHLLKLRELQDETQGFYAFVPLAYQVKRDGLFGSVETSGFLDLKVLSISRLLLDNIPHIKIHWSTTSLKFAQAALFFGADDIGGTNLDEKVMQAAGNLQSGGLSSENLIRFIKGKGLEPCRVDSSYQMNL